MENNRRLVTTLVSQLPVTAGREDLPKLTLPRLKISLLCLAMPIAGIIILPVLYLVLWVSEGTDVLGVLSNRLSFQWIITILTDKQWDESIVYSVVMACLASLAGTASLAVNFYSSRYAEKFYGRLAFGLVVLVVLLPSVIYALALQTVGGALRIPEMLLLLLGQTVIILPIQYFVLESAQDSLGSETLYAGSTLGAHHWTNFWSVYVPLNRESLWSVLVVGFFLAFDELVIASFVIHSALLTVPKRLWDRIDSTNDPAPAVISLFVFALYLAQVALVFAYRTWKGRYQAEGDR